MSRNRGEVLENSQAYLRTASGLRCFGFAWPVYAVPLGGHSSRAEARFTVLAFLALKGTQSAEPDLEEARRLASSALSGERGYANYVLGCIAIKEGQVASVAQFLGESHKAGYVPAATLLAGLTLESPQLSAKAKSSAASLLRRASAAGHRPAQLILCRAYLRGRLGLAERLLGICLLPIAAARLMVSLKYRVFSVNSFFYSNKSGPIFTEEKVRKQPSTGPFTGLLGLTHVAMAIFAAAVLSTKLDSASLDWIALAMWPYGVSFLVAARVDSRSWVSTAVQTLLLLLLTSLICSAYLGQLFDLPINTWTR